MIIEIKFGNTLELIKAHSNAANLINDSNVNNYLSSFLTIGKKK